MTNQIGKKSYNKLPAHLQEKLSIIEDRFLVVAATSAVERSEIEVKRYESVGLTMDEGQIRCLGPITPPLTSGKWSKRNVLGWDIQRKDWPKTKKTFTFEAPNYGDGARNGWSTRSITKEVYQYQVYEPQGMTIEANVIEDLGGEKVQIKFTLNTILDRTADDFDRMLLWSLNVLQENVGVSGIFASNATMEDYLQTVLLDWQIFPAGSAEAVFASIYNSSPLKTRADYEAHLKDRVAFFQQLEPKNYVRGVGKFGSYFGAQFAADFVVLENLKYGNAIYVLYSDWQELSQRSRIDLLRDNDSQFDRVIHSHGWETRLAVLINEKLFERGIRGRRRVQGRRRRK